LTPPVRLTFTASRGVTNGLASFLAQEEMDRAHGFWWSPDSSYLAFEHVDERHIPEYRIVHQGSDRVGEGAQEDHRYPFAGKLNPICKLFIVDVEASLSKQQDSTRPSPPLVEVDLNVFHSQEVYLARVEWFPDGTLAVQVENRNQSSLKLLRFDLRTGITTTLLEETSQVWINLHDLFVPLRLDKQDGFLWGSERSAFMHLYLYKLLATGGEWIVEQISGVDEEAGLVFFHGNCDNPMERHMYVADLLGQCSYNPPRLTPKGGHHACVIDHRFHTVCCLRSSICQPATVR